MSAHVSYFKLGLFVVVSVTLLITGVIILGAGMLFERTITFETFTTESVEGIGVGSDVKYRGIGVGTVSAMSLANKKYDPDSLREGRVGSAILIELAINPEVFNESHEDVIANWLEPAVAEGFRARAASSGLTGPAFIELVFLDPEDFPEPSIAWEPPALYIPSAPSTAQVLLSSIEKILRNIDGIDLAGTVADLDELLDSANGALGGLDLKTLDDDARGLIKELRAKVDELDTQTINDESVALLKDFRGSGDRLREILDNPAIDPSIDDMRATLQNSNEASARLNEILNDPRVDEILTQLDGLGDEVEPTLKDFRRMVRRIDLLIASQQAAIANVLAEMERALESVNEVAEDATQNPSRILFGDPPPRFKSGNKP